jgi:hypothetical protein
MKRIIINIILLLGLITSNSFSLSNFWYFGIAYTPKGMVIKDTQLDSVSVTVTDGLNSMTQKISGLSVDSTGKFRILINGNGLNSIKMNVGTRITLSINGISIISQPLSNWYLFRNKLTSGSSNNDSSVDGWISYLTEGC